MRAPRGLIGMLAAPILLGDLSARADSAEAVHFSYDAPQGCPPESLFVETVRADGGGFTPAPEGAAARELHVRITAGERVSGELVVHDRTGTEAVRTIEGERCQDVASALAVLVSLALEEGSAAATPAASRARPERLEPPPEKASVTAPLPPGWRVGASGEGTVGGLGASGFGLAANVEIIRDQPEGFTPALRLGFESAQGGTTVPARGGAYLEGASLQRYVARLDACPLRGVAARPWSPSPVEAWMCARLDVGTLDVSSSTLLNATDVRRAWAAAGALVHLRWVFWRVFLDVEGGLIFPLTRERFVIEPSVTAYQVPTVTGTGGLTLGFYFL